MVQATKVYYKCTVKSFKSDKGFGFLTCSEFPGQDIYLHYSDIVMSGYKSVVPFQVVYARVRDTIEPEGYTGPKRLAAFDVRITDPSLNK